MFTSSCSIDFQNSVFFPVCFTRYWCRNLIVDRPVNVTSALVVTTYAIHLCDWERGELEVVFLLIRKQPARLSVVKASADDVPDAAVIFVSSDVIDRCCLDYSADLSYLYDSEITNAVSKHLYHCFSVLGPSRTRPRSKKKPPGVDAGQRRAPRRTAPLVNPL